MTDYSRVVFLDSDNIFIDNMDALFRCGHFCVVFMNPLLFRRHLVIAQVRQTTHGSLRKSDWFLALKRTSTFLLSTSSHAKPSAPTARLAPHAVGIHRIDQTRLGRGQQL